MIDPTATEDASADGRTTVQLLRNRNGKRRPIKVTTAQLELINKEAVYIDPEGSANARFCLTGDGLMLEFDGDAEDVLGYSGPEICNAVLAAERIVPDVRDLLFWRGDKLCARLSDESVMEVGVLC